MNSKITKILAAIFVVVVIVYITERYSISGELPDYDIPDTKYDSVLTIGIIGDSWAGEKKLDQLLHGKLANNGLSSRVISSAHPGARSKYIYHDLFKDPGKSYSMKGIVESKPDYCIVVAGVNDAASQVGSRFYSTHMTHIMKTLLHHNIIPVVVTLPEFGIRENTDNMNFFRKYRNMLAAMINNHGEIDNIQTYRKAFENELKLAGLNDKVVLVDFDCVCKDYGKSKHFYSNSMHLSSQGNDRLCEAISKALMQHLEQTQITGSDVVGSVHCSR